MFNKRGFSSFVVAIVSLIILIGISVVLKTSDMDIPKINVEQPDDNVEILDIHYEQPVIIKPADNTFRIPITGMVVGGGGDGDYGVSQLPNCTAGCGGTISTSCELNQSLNCGAGTGLTLGAVNVVLDCNGFDVNGTGTAGIYVTGYNNVTVQNCNVNHFQVGIRFDSSSDNSFMISNNIFNTSSNGVSLASSTNLTIDSNNVSNSSLSGFIISSVTNSNFTGNRVLNNSQYGFNMIGSSYNIFEFNKVLQNSRQSASYAGFYVSSSSSSNNFTNNTANGNLAYGFYFRTSASNNRIINNTAVSNTLNPIYIRTNSNYNILTDNNFTSGSDEIRDNGNTGTTFKDNTIDASYSFTNSVGVTFEDTGEGKVVFLDSMSGTGSSLTSTVQIGSNLVDVDTATESEFNVSANITIYSTNGLGLIDRAPFRDGIKCPASVCTELSDADTYEFNVTSFSNYTVGEGAVACGDNITEDTTLIGDINMSGAGNCLTITADDVILDCAGYNLNGTDTASSYGVYASGRTNVTVKNCNITNFQHAIYFASGTNYSYVTNNTADSNTLYGLYLANSNNNTATSNTVVGGNMGFRIQTSSSNDFINNTLRDMSAHGVYMTSSIENYFFGNTVDNFNGQGISDDANSHHNVFVNNTVTNGPAKGFFVSGDSNNYTNNTAQSNVDGFYFQSGAENNIVKSNIVTSNSQYGITIEASFNTLINNSISGNTVANLNVDEASNILLKDQELFGGYRLVDAHMLTFEDTGEGKLKFLQNITRTSNNLSLIVNISSNLVKVDSATASQFNIPANLTIYNTNSLGLIDRIPYKNGTSCSASICTELTDADTYVFSVTGFTNYSVGEGAVVCGDNITEDTTLTADINMSGGGTCLWITADDITLDCAGYNIDGNDAGSSYGVRLSDQTNVTIKNCNITDFFAGIYFDNGDDSFIINNTLDSNTLRGIILLANTQWSIIANNTVTNSDTYGIIISGSSDNNITGNTVTGNGDTGIDLLSSANNNQVVNNTVNNNGLRGIRIRSTSSNSIIVNNTVKNNAGNGISVESSANALIENNVVSNNTLYQINVSSSTLTTLKNQEIWGNYSFDSAGLIVEDSGEAKIKFLQNITGSGTNLSATVLIGSNLVDVDTATESEFNVSANITIYGTNGLGLSERVPYRNGADCPASVCTEITDADTYVFNVTHFTNYSVGELSDSIPNLSNAVNTSVDFKRDHNFVANITMDDDNNLSSYIFSTNASGSWVNASASGISGTQYNASTISNITIAGGSEVCWYYWINDSLPQSALSSTYCFTVANTAPVVSAVAISPASPNTSIDLNCTYTASDIDNDALTPTYNWFKDGVAQGYNSQILVLANTSVGEVWNCSVNVSDSAEWGFAISSAVTIVDDVDPTFSSAVNTSADFKRDHNFVANITIDNNALNSYLFSTNASGSWVNTSASSISGAQYNVSTISNITVAGGSEVCWYYWANDTLNNDAVSSNYCFDVANTAPVVSAAAISPASPNATVNLNCTYTATDIDDNDVLTPTYNWYKDGASQSINNQILVLGNTTVGDVWNCSVNVSDSAEWDYLVSSAKTISDDSAPTFSSAVNTSADFKINSAFTANVTIDNANLTDYIFSTNASGSWVNASSSISGTQYNASSQVTISVANGVQVCWYYWASDDADNNATSSTYCFTVVNSAPVEGVPTVSGNIVTDDLICIASATDADSDTVSYNGRWYFNGTQNLTFTTAPINYTQGVSTAVSTLGSGNTSVGDTWSCEVRAYDGTEYSSYVNSTNTTITAVPVESSSSGGRTCDDLCNRGDVICKGDSYYVCGNFDHDTCNEWGTEDCPEGSECERKSKMCIVPPCVEDWICERWEDCDGGFQTRQCEDWNSCGTEKQKPDLFRSCFEENIVEKIGKEVDDIGEEELDIEEKAPIVEKPMVVSPLMGGLPSITTGSTVEPTFNSFVMAAVVVSLFSLLYSMVNFKFGKIKKKR